nr:ATP synthase F0 subunit 6 [Craspedonirmus immer]
MSSFDPCVSLFNTVEIQLKWVSILFPMLILSSSLWSAKSGLSLSLEKATSSLLNAMEMDLKKGNSLVLVLLGLFFFLLSSNELGLFPFFFSFTSHMAFNFSLALPLWLGSVIMGMTKSLNKTLAHLVPIGTPMILGPLMVIIEFVSLLIRPFSLGVRMMANILAGHMVLSLMGMACSSLLSGGGFAFLPVFAIQFFFNLFEIFVSLIQAFVFSTLLSLYWKESEF